MMAYWNFPGGGCQSQNGGLSKNNDRDKLKYEYIKVFYVTMSMFKILSQSYSNTPNY